MKDILYIADEKLVLIRGKGTKNKMIIANVCVSDMPAECISGGFVTDEKLFEAYLRGIILKSGLKVKKLEVILGTKASETVKMYVPDRSRKVILDYIQREFRKYRDFDRACTYIPIYKAPSSKTVKVLAGCAAIDSIDSYKSVFKNLKIKLTSVRIAIHPAVEYFTRVKKLKDLDFSMVQIVEDDTIYNILVKAGLYYHLSTHKATGHLDVRGFALESARSISTMLQFMKANDYPTENLKVFAAGYREDYFNECVNTNKAFNPAISFESLGINPEMFDRENESIYPLGFFSLLKYTKDLNLLYDYDRVKKTGNNLFKGYTTGMIALAAVLVCLTGYFRTVAFLDRIELAREVEETAELKIRAGTYDTLYAETIDLENKLNGVIAVKDNLESYPHGNEKAMNAIRRVAGDLVSLQFLGYDADTGSFICYAYTENAVNANKFAAALENSDAVANVTYSGFSYDDSLGKYAVNVTFNLDESAGK